MLQWMQSFGTLEEDSGSIWVWVWIPGTPRSTSPIGRSLKPQGTT